jgi:hypothetical protein
MTDDRRLDLKRQLLDEIWEEIGSLKGEELDDYLATIGLAPDGLLQDYSEALSTACAAPKRARFEEARRQLRQKSGADFSKILSFDVAKKKVIMAAIREHAARTNEMTIAARNQKIEDEGDLDSFLEACVRLGLIDGEGNLKG